MRKSLVVFAVFFLFAIGVICYADTSLLNEKDNVQITETILYGEKAAVEGVTIERNTKYDRYMRWNTTYTAGEKPECNTDYTFDESGGLWDEIEYVPDGIEFSTTIVGGTELADNTGTNLTGVNRAIWELFQETEPGEIGYATINLADYLDYYEYDIQFNLPGVADYFMTTSEIKDALVRYGSNNADYKKELEDKLYVIETMTEFFKIPVIENQLYNIAVAKGEDGKMYGWGYDCANGGGSSGTLTDGATSLGEPPENADMFDIWAICAYTEDKCYFTFEPYTRNGERIDTSLIVGGYGIYCLSFDKETHTIDADSLAMVYPLELTETVYNLYYNADRGELLLLQGKEEGSALTVIEESTMTVMQEVIYTKQGYSSEYYIGDDFLLLTCDNTMFVLSVSEEEYYEKEFECRIDWLAEKLEVDYVEFNEMAFDWNGEALLIAGSLRNLKNNYNSYFQNCGFYLTAYDRTGPVYCGIYESSLDAKRPYVNSQRDTYYNYSNRCRPTDADAIKVWW